VHALQPGQDVATTLKHLRRIQASFTHSTDNDAFAAGPAGVPGAGADDLAGAASGPLQLRTGSVASLSGRRSGERQWLGSELRVGSITSVLPSGASGTGSLTAQRLHPRMGSITEGHSLAMGVDSPALGKLPYTPSVVPHVPRTHSVTSLVTPIKTPGTALAAPFQRLSLTSSPQVLSGSGHVLSQRTSAGSIQGTAPSYTAAAGASASAWYAADDRVSSPASSRAPAPLPTRRCVGVCDACVASSRLHVILTCKGDGDHLHAHSTLTTGFIPDSSTVCPPCCTPLPSHHRSLQTRLSNTMPAGGANSAAAAARDAAVGSSFAAPHTPARHTPSMSQIVTALGPAGILEDQQGSPMWPQSPPAAAARAGSSTLQRGAGVVDATRGAVVQRTASVRLPPRTPSRTMFGGSSPHLMASGRAPSISGRLSAPGAEGQGGGQQVLVGAGGEKEVQSAAGAGAPSFRRLISSRMSLSRMRMVLQSYEVSEWGLGLGVQGPHTHRPGLSQPGASHCVTHLSMCT
jgi:hypothetical protein